MLRSYNPELGPRANATKHFFSQKLFPVEISAFSEKVGVLAGLRNALAAFLVT
jgi:hypothetical protein